MLLIDGCAATITMRNLVIFTFSIMLNDSNIYAVFLTSRVLFLVG